MPALKSIRLLSSEWRSIEENAFVLLGDIEPPKSPPSLPHTNPNQFELAIILLHSIGHDTTQPELRIFDETLFKLQKQTLTKIQLLHTSIPLPLAVTRQSPGPSSPIPTDSLGRSSNTHGKTLRTRRTHSIFEPVG
jgi:hypothetical protein